MSPPEPVSSPSGEAPHAGRDRTRGFAYGLGAYGLWGLIPIYFKAVSSAPPLELISHRVVWALGMLAVLAAWQRRFAELREAFASRRTMGLLAGTTVLIALNWLIYIWAVVNGRIVEASLGYFMTPLVNVLLGVLVLKERLDRPVVVALGLAAAGVLWLTVLSGRPPWVSLGLAASYGSYGLLRKLVRVGAAAGLTLETAFLFPLALGYLVAAERRGTLAFLSGPPGRDLLLVLAGPVTAIPLLLFAGAAQRLPLTSLGFLQYLSPTLQFLLATLVYREPFGAAQGAAFGLIWLALLVFAVHAVRGGMAEPVMEP